MTLPYAPARWPSVTATVVLWAAAAASIVFWGLRMAAPADGVLPPAVSTVATLNVDSAAVGRALGAQPVVERVAAAPDAASRFVLLGVVADDLGRGAALIAVDGKPARPFRVGSVLADGYVLQSLDARTANIGGARGGAAVLSLKLPVQPLAVNGPVRPPPLMPRD
jgi:general secretion pathway protein C